MKPPAVDRAIAAISVVILAPVMLAIAVAIRVTSRGPALHRATRVGSDGRTFTFLKFRTMVADAGSHGSSVTASGDPRVTRVGSVLRLTKLDELPQLLNVLRGEMRLVGWRPEDPKYLDLDDPAQAELVRHLPGLTSPASIAFRHEESILARAIANGADLDAAYRQIAREKTSLDLDYLRTRTTGSDLGVLWRTVWSVVRSSGRTAGDDQDGAMTTGHAFELDDVYRSYEGAYAERWGSNVPGNRAIVAERERVARELLGDVDVPAARVLDLGAGGSFPGLFPGGFRICLDILFWRLELGRSSGTAGAPVCADGAVLPVRDGSIDVVLLSTVLSSIDAELGRAVLAEVERVVRPGGAVIVYDFRVSNPRNHATHGVSRRSVTGAMSGFTSRARSVTLAPPIARRLGHRTELLYGLLLRLRFARTHNVIVGRRCAS